MSEHDDSDFSRAAAETLRSLGAEPVVIGGIAAIRFRAVPRMTTDIDFLIRSHVEGIEEAFRAAGFEVRALQNAADQPYLYLIRGGGDVRIDVLVADTEYQTEAFDRAVDGFLTPEDVIVHKLIAWRGRDQDDIRSILDAGHALDESYIRRWADEWDVADRWREANGSPD